jgi:hypothetical protein
VNPRLVAGVEGRVILHQLARVAGRIQHHARRHGRAVGAQRAAGAGRVLHALHARLRKHHACARQLGVFHAGNTMKISRLSSFINLRMNNRRRKKIHLDCGTQLYSQHDTVQPPHRTTAVCAVISFNRACRQCSGWTKSGPVSDRGHRTEAGMGLCKSRIRLQSYSAEHCEYAQQYMLHRLDMEPSGSPPLPQGAPCAMQRCSSMRLSRARSTRPYGRASCLIRHPEHHACQALLHIALNVDSTP